MYDLPGDLGCGSSENHLGPGLGPTTWGRGVHVYVGYGLSLSSCYVGRGLELEWLGKHMHQTWSFFPEHGVRRPHGPPGPRPPRPPAPCSGVCKQGPSCSVCSVSIFREREGVKTGTGGQVGTACVGRDELWSHH